MSRWQTALALLMFATATAAQDRSSLEGRWTDGTVVYEVSGERLTVWAVARPDERQSGSIRVAGNRLTIELDGERETLTFRLDGDRLRTTDADGVTETLRRIADPPVREPPSAGEPAAVEWTEHRCLDHRGLRDASGSPLEVFRLSVPRGWTFDGGVTWNIEHTAPVHLTRTQLLVPAQIAFTVAAPDGGSALQIYPEVHFADLTQSPAAQLGQFPPGSDYGGAISQPVAAPEAFVRDFVLPRQRRLDAGSVRIVETREVPQLAAQFDREAATLNRIAGAAGIARVENRAAAVTIDYQTGGMAMRETFLCDLTYVRTPGITLWWPRFSASGRAPRAQFAALQGTFLTMLASIRGNPRWLLRYLKVADSNWQGVAETDAVVRRLDRAIADNRAQTNIEIQRQCYPRLAPFWYYAGPDGRQHYLSTELDHQMHDDGTIRSGRTLPVEPGWHPMREVVREAGERKRRPPGD